MHVLMVDDRSSLAEATAAGLRGADHAVATCGMDAVGRCAALRGGTCPLDAEPIDVAVLVRAEAGSSCRAEEAGVLCAARRRIPIVIGGNVADNPYGVIATVEDETADLVATVETVHDLPLIDHSVAATAALRASLARRGVPGEGHVRVYRRNGRLRARLHFGGVEPSRADVMTAAVRVAGAVRGVDPWAAGIDISTDR